MKKRDCDETRVLAHPDGKLPDVGPLSQGCSRLLLCHLGDEVFGVVGGLSLHGGPDGSGHSTGLAGGSGGRVVNHPQSDVVAGFLRSEGPT